MADDGMPAGLRHEGPGGYSMTPLWVILAARKDVWLYDYLRARYGGLDEVFPGINTLAKALKVSRSTIERALAALIKVGAIEVVPRQDPRTGARITNVYVTKFHPPTTP